MAAMRRTNMSARSSRARTRMRLSSDAQRVALLGQRVISECGGIERHRLLRERAQLRGRNPGEGERKVAELVEPGDLGDQLLQVLPGWAFRVTLDPVIGGLPAGQIAREQPVEHKFLFIRQASRDPFEQPGLSASVDLFSQPVESRERR
ncbi:hypothetical protein WS87_00725 (plasmid) [Burkholderia sp. MSMB0856]|nr:hypothetical protein WS87_00725 [Burkholderia sp. MSMB0856]